MNTSKIKAYAPKARREFIQAVTERANLYGIFDDQKIEPVEIKGDISLIGGRAFSKKEGELREKLVNRVKREGFQQVMEAYAYTWFNRFVALRYMELHDYLEHGFRVLSNRGNSHIPELLEHAADVGLQGLKKDKVIELRLAGNKDNELYRLLIVAQCNALHRAMPFLFDRIDSETELLLPDNLLHSNSPIRKLVNDIDEDSWQDVEIIGWIYQFYISEKKDQVIGKVVKSEDIPAATQLFTPNWIVKYMVQNTLGRMWLATYPDSPLRDKMQYYIEPAEQKLEVQKQLDEITPKELSPEEITFLDPACGSGHILVEAYDIFKEIYLEHGYRTRDIPMLILEKNIYGLDIDDRAAQLACFSVLMKARKDDRRILNRDGLKLNVMAIQEGKSSDAFHIENFFHGDEYKNVRSVLKELLKLFENGKTFGSLISIPKHIVMQIEYVKKVVDEKLSNWFSDSDVNVLRRLVDQAWILSKKYDCVVANPPYMGNQYLNNFLKDYLKSQYSGFEKDLFSVFIIQIFNFVKRLGLIALVSPFVWMFLTNYLRLRKRIVTESTLTSLIRPEYHSFFDSAYVPLCTFTVINKHIPYRAEIFDLNEFTGAEIQKLKFIEALQNKDCSWRYSFHIDKVNSIPGNPIAYWLTDKEIEIFDKEKKMNEYADLKQGLITGNNDKFLRYWYEVSYENFRSQKRQEKIMNNPKWFPYQKGGDYRKWYGNNEYVVNWENDGSEIKNYFGKNKRLASRPQNIKYYFKKGGTWSSLTIGSFAMRYVPEGYIFDAKGPMCFEKSKNDLYYIIAFSNSKIIGRFLSALAPTLDYSQGPVGNVPIIFKSENSIKELTENAIVVSKEDWDSYERSWDFSFFPVLNETNKSSKIEASISNWKTQCANKIKRLQEIENEISRLFIGTYDLHNELLPEVPIDQITLTVNPKYRYGTKYSDEELNARFLKDTIKELISYSIGCMMGRYSLDHPGLIYFRSGNIDFNPSKYKTFPADDDGIIPIMNQEWFPDDATNRFVQFLKVAWSPETLTENLKFVADSLKPKTNEAPVDTIRRYMSTSFFKDHLKTYKKRPIYWLFSSGKQSAFECLVYLHRYNESTLSRIRSVYVTPLQGNFSARIEFLQNEKDAATTASAQRKLQKEIEMLRKKQEELRKFDDELRHYADMKIALDLDDGVKVNYGKFGNLLAEKKAVTGT